MSVKLFANRITSGVLVEVVVVAEVESELESAAARRPLMLSYTKKRRVSTLAYKSEIGIRNAKKRREK